MFIVSTIPRWFVKTMVLLQHYPRPRCELCSAKMQNWKLISVKKCSQPCFPHFPEHRTRVVCSPVEVLIDNVLWCLNVGACFFKVSVPAMLGVSRLSFRWFQSQRFSKQFLTFDIIDDDNEVWMVYQDVLDKNNFNQL